MLLPMKISFPVFQIKYDVLGQYEFSIYTHIVKSDYLIANVKTAFSKRKFVFN